MANVTQARALALVVPVALVGGAYAFQYWGGLFPCEMCWWQRYAHFAAIAFAVAAFVLPAKKLFVALAGLAIAVSALIGGYHAGVEYGWFKGLTECTTLVNFGAGGDPLAAIMNAPIIRCDVVQWKIFGISLAGFNFILSALGAVGVFALLLRGKKA
ncbi:disulfide bond formation protein B [Novosphingobium terrae]|uniref:disulfide bond formation protein B n=1 Tax=Novosphingobium terrae TaxID=2726189 RepID=UPI00197D847C|nr:disulfide bond formation protein B [Novosphingobium terrae]